MSDSNQSSNDNAQPLSGNSDTTQPSSPFLNQPLPQGTPQGQQQSLQPGVSQPASGQTTHFGYKTVAVEEKQQKVAEVFHSVASKYDLMNDLMSFGIHSIS